MQSLATFSGAALVDAINASQYEPTSTAGFYESYFLRANHPVLPQAFWIRYTVFSPRGSTGRAEGQLWAVYFDGATATTTAIKQSLPFTACAFSRTRLGVRIGDATLDPGALRGVATSASHRLSWDLSYRGHAPPSFLMPLAMYHREFPRAKVLTGLPLATFSGSLAVDDRTIAIDEWLGSQNHNWGTRHTDRYAWGQVCGFDGHPEAFLECSTARLRLGLLWSPWLTNLTLRLPGQEFRLNSLWQALRNEGRYRCFEWTLAARSGDVAIEVRFSAAPDAFVALGYDDPPGGRRTCLNSKLASCTVRIAERGKPPLTLQTAHRAAFEILATTEAHDIALSA